MKVIGRFVICLLVFSGCFLMLVYGISCDSRILGGSAIDSRCYKHGEISVMAYTTNILQHPSP